MRILGGGADVADWPLFPDALGRTVAKDKVVDTIKALAVRTGQPVLDSRGGNLYGGHSLRTGGAVYLTALGLDALRVEILARWASPMLAHYAQLAPLKSLTTECKRRYFASDADGSGTSTRADRNADLSRLQTSLDQLATKLDEVQAQEVRVLARLDALDAQSLPHTYVVNATSGKWHRILFEDVDGHLDQWLAYCGWRFGKARYTRHRVIAPNVPACDFCERCLPEERSARSIDLEAADSSDGAAGV